jgi:hypothetical protein
MNIVDISRGNVIRKIKRLENYKQEYIAIKGIKQRYLNSLQSYATYHTISIECHRIQQELKTLESQLADMDVKLNLLKKEL